MSENYVKKYDVGQIKLDLPTANYIHELPLLSFGDVQHTVNLSMMFNYGAYKEEIASDYTGEVNPFGIASGYKLNLQKKLNIDDNFTPYSLLDENGKPVSINSQGNIGTFDDDSMRLIKREERNYTPLDPNPKDDFIPAPITDYVYIVEYPDYSKEEYSSSGHILAVYDKYGAKFLEYTYSNDRLTKITYNSSKKIIFGYTNSTLSSIKYKYNNEDIFIIGVNIANNGCVTVTKNSEIFTYFLTPSTTDESAYQSNLHNLKVTVTEEDNNAQSTPVSYYKKIEFVDDEMIVSDDKNNIETNVVTYKYPVILDSSLSQINYVDVIDKNGVKMRAQIDGGEIKYSYEIGNDGPIFYNGTDTYNTGYYLGTVQTAGTENSSDSLTIRFGDGVNIANIQNLTNEYPVATYNPNNELGYAVFSGWVRKHTSENSDYGIQINNKIYPLSLSNSFYPTPWRFFAIKIDLSATINNATIGIRDPYSASNVEFKGLKLTFHPSPLPIFINKATGSQHFIDKETFTDIFSVDSPDTISVTEFMKYKQDTFKGVENKVLFYNGGKNAIFGITNPTLNIDNAHISIHDLDIGTKYVKSGKTYVSRTYFNTNDIVTTQTVSNGDATHVVNSQTLDGNFDLVSATNENNQTVNYTRSNGLVTSEFVSGLYTRTTSYGTNTNGEPTVTQTDEFGNSTAYTLDKVWGGIKSVALPNGTVIEDTYDSDMCALLNRKFANGRNNAIGYFEGNVCSMSNGDLNYQFGYTNKGELASVTKNGAGVEQHTYDDENNKVTSHYPTESGSAYSPIVHLDKYGRTVEVENVLEITYDVHPIWYYVRDEEYEHEIYGNAFSDAKVAEFKDKLRNETTKYGYDEKHLRRLRKINSSNNSKIAEETFEYDKEDRLTKDTCVYDIANNKSVKSVIEYTHPESHPLADGNVNKYSYYLNGATSPAVETENEFDSFNRVITKYHFIEGNEFVKDIIYDKTRPETLYESFNGSTFSEINYRYDGMGRIIFVDNGEAVTYEYDDYGQLTKETNNVLDKSFQYVYNDIGNITSVITTPKNGSAYTTTFTYGNTTHPDRLTSYNGKTIGYNSMGCPTSYDGRTFGWSKGKLQSISQGSVKNLSNPYTRYVYTYNALGQRVTKTYSYRPGAQALVDYMTDSNCVFTYDNAGRLIHEKRSENYKQNYSYTREFTYLYDESGMIGFTYSYDGGTPQAYYYQRNLQGDVIAIYNTSGVVQVEYAYDAWGNCTITYSANPDIANSNAIRYRGYYWDSETGWYFLNARYYSPEWRRFISPDDAAYLDPENVNGLNLYCYCNNDPVNATITSEYCNTNFINYSLTNGIVGFHNTTLNPIKSLPKLSWIVENSTSIYGALSSINSGIPIAYHYVKYASVINDEFRLYGISKLKTSLQLSNVNLKPTRLDGALIGVNAVLDMYDSIQRGVSANGVLLGGTLTAASSFGMMYLNKGIMWMTTTIGTAISPGLGTAIGFSVGVVSSILADIFFGGWIADWIDRNVK